MWTLWVIYNFLCVVVAIAQTPDFKAFDDNILFKINWPGKNAELLVPKPDVEPYVITTANNEKYQCLIPDINRQKKEPVQLDINANRMLYLYHILEREPCSYKHDPYWSYELCHGKFVRQYHDERDGKKLKTQSYYLGIRDNAEKLKLPTEYEEWMKDPSKKAKIPVTKIDGLNMPYLEIEMGDGTECDLNNKPRKIRVLYVCYEQSKNDIFSVKETSSCEYEAIVFTPLLCSHPDYRSPDVGENEINCLPVDNAPNKPKALSAMEAESLKLMHQKLPDDNQQKVYAIFHVDKEGQDGEERFRVEIHPGEVIDKHASIEESINSLVFPGISPAEISPVQNFLSGKNCLNGGNGWWKYEFCYGRFVVQYHIERDGTKTIVNLGNFNKQKHLEWIANHPHKKPKAPESRTHLSHFYSDGSVCDKTGQPRQTEVTLKCGESHMTSPSSVSLFLVEPKTCEYLLGVESPLICDILGYADENGLLSEKFEVNFDKLKTTSFHIEQDESDERIASEDD